VGREEGTLQHGDCRATQNQKKDDEVDVRVITRGGEKMGMDFEHGESSGQRPEGKIRKVVQPPPKFDVAQQKQFLCDAKGP
jgi:hypothetical protein